MKEMGNFVCNDVHEFLGTLGTPAEDIERTDTPNSIYLISNGDPRSPTQGIYRTPIEIPQRRTLSQLQENDLVLGSSSLSRGESTYAGLTQAPGTSSTLVMLTNDPRSPTSDFIRSPIVVQSNLEKCDGTESSPEKMNMDDELITNVVICDPRSPSEEICRTPIQIPVVAEADKTEEKPSARLGLLETDIDAVLNNTNKATDLTRDRHLMQIFEDMDKLDLKSPCLKANNLAVSGDKLVKLGKENETSLKRKLFLTPELSPGLKVRTPLGTMSNVQNSPSLLLRMKQTQKINLDSLVSTPNSARSEKQIRRRQVVEWDNDTTFLM